MILVWFHIMPWISYTLLFILIQLTRSQGCSVGWFGDRCQFKCHCNNNTNCYSNGSCTDSNGCEKGWFGFKCQYRDLANSSVSDTTIYNKTLTDGDDTTCLEENDFNSIEIKLNRSFIFTWIRIAVQNTNLLTRFTLSFKSNSNQTSIGCHQAKYSLVNNITVDISCQLTEPVQQIIIEGLGVAALCSLYINGGRNIALKQNAQQSSNNNPASSASNAVDGNSDVIFSKNSCTHTVDADRSPRWNLTFDAMYTVYMFIIFNRGDCCQARLIRFHLQTQDDKGIVLMNYTDPQPNAAAVYYVHNNGTLPVKKTSIAPTNPSPSLLLTLCEVEMYGDCPPGKWDLSCNQICNSTCPTKCNVHDGKCETTCVGSSNPPDCTSDCVQGRWGLNCSNTCHNCLHMDCNKVTGDCIQGCLGYSNPPYCTESCEDGYSGKNCTDECSYTCLNKSCNASTGYCNKCEPGYVGVFCQQDCSSGFWGEDCIHSCSINCFNDSCDNINGLCSLGCVGSVNYPFCNYTCKSGSYGMNCTEACKSNCVNETCHSLTGRCSEKALSEMSSAPGTPTIIGIVLPFSILGLIATIVAIEWRKRFFLYQLRKIFPPGTDTVELSHMDFHQKRKSKCKSTMDNVYENSSDESKEDTSLSVNVFDFFIKNNESEFYIQQFQKIPKPINVSTTDAASVENRKKNRYTNISPYDHNRVMLKINPARHEGDYINASHISGYDDVDKFIASQGPHKATVNDFIRMIFEHKTDKIVMLTQLVESGKVKCEKYWPDDGKSRFGNIKVAMKTSHTYSDYTISLLELTKKSGASHRVTHFHFTAWLDNNVPVSSWSLVEFIHKVSLTPSLNPTLVHCSAGIGRTGTYIAVHNAIKQAEKTGTIDVFNIVAKLRQERMFMVQNPVQYEFIFKTVHTALMCSETTLPGNTFIETYKTLDDRSSTVLQDLETNFSQLNSMYVKEGSLDDNDYAEYQYGDNVATSTDVKDRFASILPNVDYKIILSKETKDYDDYINAVFVPGYRGKSKHILTQLPMPSTVVDFWRMVIQQRAAAVITFEFDALLSDKSFGNYLQIEHLPKTFPYEVHSSHTKQSEFWEETGFMVHIRKTAFKSENHSLVHFKSVSTDMNTTKMFTVLKHVRSLNSLNKTIVFMCRNGATYSGLACTLYLLMERFDNDLYVSVPAVVGTIKSIRPEVIHNLDQYVFVHNVLQRYIELSSQYNNVGDNMFNKSTVRTDDERVEDEQVYVNIMVRE